MCMWGEGGCVCVCVCGRWVCVGAGGRVILSMMSSITKGSSTNQRLEINSICKRGIGSLHSTYSEGGIMPSEIIILWSSSTNSYQALCFQFAGYFKEQVIWNVINTSSHYCQQIGHKRPLVWSSTVTTITGFWMLTKLCLKLTVRQL